MVGQVEDKKDVFTYPIMRSHSDTILWYLKTTHKNQALTIIHTSSTK